MASTKRRMRRSKSRSHEEAVRGRPVMRRSPPGAMGGWHGELPRIHSLDPVEGPYAMGGVEGEGPQMLISVPLGPFGHHDGDEALRAAARYDFLTPPEPGAPPTTLAGLPESVPHYDHREVDTPMSAAELEYYEVAATVFGEEILAPLRQLPLRQVVEAAVDVLETYQLKSEHVATLMGSLVVHLWQGGAPGQVTRLLDQVARLRPDVYEREKDWVLLWRLMDTVLEPKGGAATHLAELARRASAPDSGDEYLAHGAGLLAFHGSHETVAEVLRARLTARPVVEETRDDLDDLLLESLVLLEVLRLGEGAGGGATVETLVAVLTAMGWRGDAPTLEAMITHGGRGVEPTWTREELLAPGDGGLLRRRALVAFFAHVLEHEHDWPRGRAGLAAVAMGQRLHGAFSHTSGPSCVRGGGGTGPLSSLWDRRRVAPLGEVVEYRMTDATCYYTAALALAFLPWLELLQRHGWYDGAQHEAFSEAEQALERLAELTNPWLYVDKVLEDTVAAPLQEVRWLCKALSRRR